MKTKFIGALAVLLASASATPAFAAAIVYNVNQTIGSGSVTGTITTDGTTGTPLTASNITAWNLLVTGANSISTLLKDGQSEVRILGGNVSATASGLFFNYTGSDQSYLLFQRSFGNGQEYYCNSNLDATCYRGQSAVPESYNSASAQYNRFPEGIQQIASVAAVPEPATWGLMMVGFGMIGFAARRRAKTTVRFALA